MHASGTLRTAVVDNDVALVELLIESGADVSEIAPFHFACDKGHTEIVRLLLELDRDITVPASGLSSSLRLSKINNIVRALIPTDPLDPTDVNFGFSDAVILTDKFPQTHRLLIDLASLYASEHTALRMASENGHTEIVRMLLSNVWGSVGSALSLAAIGGHTEIVRMLMPHAGIDALNRALRWATAMGFIDIAGLLLEYGAVDFKYTRVVRLRQRTGGWSINYFRN